MRSISQLKLADQNLADSVRRQAEWTTGAALVELDGAVMTLGATRFPAAPFNALLSEGDGANASALLDRAESTFSASGRGFSVYARQHADSALELQCRSRGYLPAGDLAIMCRRPRPAHTEPNGATRVEIVADAFGVDCFSKVAAESFAGIGLPQAVVGAVFARPERLLQPTLRLVLARINGHPVGCALMLTSGEAAGIYWVGTVPSAKRQGVATACVSALMRLSSVEGARAVVLQAARAMEPFYRRLGFSTISTLRVYASVGRRKNEATRFAQLASQT